MSTAPIIPTTTIRAPKHEPAPTFGTQPRLFLGDAASPFLAPRGVFVVDDLLLVSDTGRNRVFVWRGWQAWLDAPTGEDAALPNRAPDLVLGQPDAAGTGRNAGAEASASTLQYPSGLWTDGTRLAIADAWNHRVLLWHTFPTRDGQPADVVLGQPDFASATPNAGGPGAPPTAATMHWPYGVTSNGAVLYVADTGNRRVLRFDVWPVSTGASADAVLGQADLASAEYDKRHAIWPYSVALGPDGALAIADTGCYRVLLWHDRATAFAGAQADVLLGQATFEGCGQNQFHLYPTAATLNWTYASAFVGNGLVVADSGNSRLLRFDARPAEHSAPADALYGQHSFREGGENRYGLHGTPETLYWPFSLVHHAASNTLVVADTGNHRLLFLSL
ncbi:MAG: hypothetical protein AAGG50_08075 [Bacteroidota bacterium]